MTPCHPQRPLLLVSANWKKVLREGATVEKKTKGKEKEQILSSLKNSNAILYLNDVSFIRASSSGNIHKNLVKVTSRARCGGVFLLTGREYQGVSKSRNNG